MIYELHYSNTNTYLIEIKNGYLLFDTGWAGTFDQFLKALGEISVSVADIRYILISHFHPDHMGIAQNIADFGACIVVLDVQKDFIHMADPIFEKEKNNCFLPIKDDDVRIVSIDNSRELLNKMGLNGEVIHTPGHSKDSISLSLEDGLLFVGDLNPLYELELHKGTEIGDSWEKLLCKNPKKVYYGHAKTAVLRGEDNENSAPLDEKEEKASELERYLLVKKIMKYIDKGKSLDTIQKKTGADKTFIIDVTRMYLTHQNVGVQGILDRIEIKGR